ncbi:sensor histidine kinase [Pseudonocardia sp. CA-107938]|uniref:sensor histidine kinase n=1 Tax=Pseudonocardia sp. CA-107938 TaxID=3240021 RepID=UPI003D8DF0D7
MVRLLRLAWRHIGLALELAGYAFWFLIDIAAALSDGGWLSVIAGVVVPGIVLLRRRPGMPLTTIASAALGASLVFSAVSATMHVVLPRTSTSIVDLSFTEDLALALLVIQILRSLELRRALWLTGVAAVAIVSTAAARIVGESAIPAFATLCALGWGGSVAIGLALREIDTRRRAALDDARSSERMELARELHDVVAHQVTGIVVAAQAAAVVARTSPDEVDRALAAIEAAGTDALKAMRRMVGVLRGQETGDDSAGARTPGAELADLPALIDRFDPDEQLVKLTMDAGLEHAVLPAGVAVTGYRIVQEALTNVRRHAPGVTAVEIDLRIREGALLVTVRNDGSEGRQAPLGGTGGFGLAGMAERAAALDGELTAGPMGAGVWQVAARLPLRGAA